jgi:hypothetical protein
MAASTSTLTERDNDLVTVEEFACLVPDGQKADLIDGVIYMASPDTRRNDRLAGLIKFLMQGYAWRGARRTQAACWNWGGFSSVCLSERKAFCLCAWTERPRCC